MRCEVCGSETDVLLRFGPGHWIYCRKCYKELTDKMKKYVEEGEE